MKTRSKKAKKHNHTEDCKKQPREIRDQCKKKSFKPVCVVQDRLVCTYKPEKIRARALTQMKKIAKVFFGKKATHEVCGEVESRFKVESRFEQVESRFEEEDFSETPTRAQFEKPNTGLSKENLEPIKEVLEDDDSTRKEVDEIVPEGGYPGGKTREQRRDMGDNMRCLYRCHGLCTAVSNAALRFEMSVERGDWL